jgi:hypothetical protein
MSIRFPKLAQIPNRQEGVTAFGGLNHNLRIRDGEFYAMRNMTSDLLPVISSRKKRKRLRNFYAPNGMHAHNELCWASADKFYYAKVGAVGEVINSKKQFVNIGSKVLIFPDAAFYDTASGEFGQLGAKYVSTGSVTATLCKLDGTAYKHTSGTTAPENPAHGDCWMDTSGETPVLRQWSDNSKNWVSIVTVYTKIEAEGIGKAFDVNDGVTLSGFTNKALNGEFYIVQKGDNYIVVVALITAGVEQTEPVTVERKIPALDFVVEYENRLYGCNSSKHEIYVSALGNPKNWHQHLGIASDSFAATVGSLGNFTGATTKNGYVLFFKEDCVHMVSPFNTTFRVTEMACEGVARDCAKSLCNVNGTLYYMGADGVYAFGNGNPYKISDSLGKGRLTEGIAGHLNGKYYLSARNESGNRDLYVYDPRTGVWMREDEIDAWYMVSHKDDLFVMDTDGFVWSMAGDDWYANADTVDEGEVEWMLETGDIGFERQAAQFVSSIQLHAEAEAHCPFYVEIQYNGKGDWEQVYEYNPAERRSMVIPIIPRRARIIRLRLHGTGDFQLYSMTMRIETGSDHYVTQRY